MGPVIRIEPRDLERGLLRVTFGLGLQLPLLSRQNSAGRVMKSKAVVVALLIGVIFLNSRAEARGPYGSISVGNWKGGAFTNDASGEFHFLQRVCAVPQRHNALRHHQRQYDLAPGIFERSLESDHRAEIPDRSHLRRAAAIQCFRRSHRPEIDGGGTA